MASSILRVTPRSFSGSSHASKIAFAAWFLVADVDDASVRWRAGEAGADPIGQRNKEFPGARALKSLLLDSGDHRQVDRFLCGSGQNYKCYAIKQKPTMALYFSDLSQKYYSSWP